MFSGNFVITCSVACTDIWNIFTRILSFTNKHNCHNDIVLPLKSGIISVLDIFIYACSFITYITIEVRVWVRDSLHDGQYGNFTKSVIPNLVASLVLFGIAFSFILKICSPAGYITSYEVINSCDNT